MLWQKTKNLLKIVRVSSFYFAYCTQDSGQIWVLRRIRRIVLFSHKINCVQSSLLLDSCIYFWLIENMCFQNQYNVDWGTSPVSKTAHPPLFLAKPLPQINRLSQSPLFYGSHPSILVFCEPPSTPPRKDFHP